MTAPSPTESLVSALYALLEPRPEVLEAYLFGSQARGEARQGSDVDVAVYIDEANAPPSGFGYQAGLTTDLMAGLRRNDVDLEVLAKALDAGLDDFERFARHVEDSLEDSSECH